MPEAAGLRKRRAGERLPPADTSQPGSCMGKAVISLKVKVERGNFLKVECFQL
jgi:hypothetical protein